MKPMSAPTVNIRILVVDDEKDITDLLVRHFRFKGYDIVGVTHPRTALKLIEEENFSIVITDIVMPDLSGLDLLRRIKEYNGGIQVFMITGYVTMYNILTAMRLGAERIFFKPLDDLDELEAALQGGIQKIAMWHHILKRLKSCGSGGSTHVNVCD